MSLSWSTSITSISFDFNSAGNFPLFGGWEFVDIPGICKKDSGFAAKDSDAHFEIFTDGF